ncbi:MAG TPA: M20/M25/M40 family metallo-hydrolase [Thermoanaerobaculia bacterium]|jgi:Tol biopolymer transport system component/Zn-dependent M28 family amino/carboxypeptidase|nr:M20/M25/M40 family metallo-hydrolase [Thermoanaerobaculia bacterium]
MRPFFVPFLLAGLLGSGPATAATAATPAEDTLHPLKVPPLDPRESHLSGLIQLTHRGENAEAYWSPDGTELILQSTRPPYACDQIFRQRADGTGTPILVSTGKGRTTCSYFMADGKRVLFSSTHAAGPECPPNPDRSHGYVWAIYPTYEIYSAKPDGSDLVRLTDNQAYDAESTVCPKDGSVIFTSTRDGDLDLYRMDADGRNVKRLTNTPGYDGGAFFSPDCKQIVWRASRPKPGPELEEYKRLLAQGLVHPTQLEIWMANADGSDARQVTYLGAASFAPSFFPSGNRLLFSSNYGDPKGREFDVWAIDTDGTNLERITWTAGFDGFPLFSPDGTRLAFSSNRNQSEPGETDVYVARWVDHPAADNAATGPSLTAAAERFRDDVRWLADDEREGRGIGTEGLDETSRWLARRFRELSLESVGGEGYFQSFEVPVAVAARPGTAMTVDGAAVARDAFQPAAFSSSGQAAGPVVAAGYGITASELGIDDYKGIEAKGKIVVVRRFTPEGGPFAQKDAEQRYGDLRYKAWNAREHGAAGLIVVDAPNGSTPPAEAPLPSLAIDRSEAAGGDAGLPVVTLKRDAGSRLFAGSHQAVLKIDLERQTRPAVNVVGVLRATGTDRLPGAVLVGAHYDHLGFGGSGSGSLAPDSHEVHRGADDNGSGTAALLEVARQLAAQRNHLRRDVYVVAFSGEEAGVLGSTAFTRKPPAGLKLADLVGMLNMDMVGRLRGNQVAVLGGESAAEWKRIVPPVCDHDGILCTLSGDGYGPSDHSSFYAAGVPVLHFFTGAHEDYHKPSDDAAKINAAGGARVATLVADVAETLANDPGRPTYKSAPSPAPRGDSRSYGASLGTVPDYAGDGRPGVLLAGVRPGSGAEQAGIQRGDLLVELGGKEIRDIHDFMFVLQRAKPGDKTTAVVVRDGKRKTVEVTFGTSRR